MEQNDTFDEWAVLEIMGHQRYAGRVTEQTVGGCSFIRIDVPEIKSSGGSTIPAFSKLFGQSSIFCITPVAKSVAIDAAQALRERPVIPYNPTPLLDHAAVIDDDCPY